MKLPPNDWLLAWFTVRCATLEPFGFLPLTDLNIQSVGFQGVVNDLTEHHPTKKGNIYNLQQILVQVIFKIPPNGTSILTPG